MEGENTIRKGIRARGRRWFSWGSGASSDRTSTNNKSVEGIEFGRTLMRSTAGN